MGLKKHLSASSFFKPILLRRQNSTDQAAECKKSITHHSYSHTSTLNRCSESSDSVSSDLAEIAAVEKIASSEVACHIV